VARFDFGVQVDVGFRLLIEDDDAISPTMWKMYQPGEEFPAAFLPIVGDCIMVTEGFCPEVTMRVVGADLVLIQARIGPFSDLPMGEPDIRSMKQRIIDALQADGFH
jgi:hypothetical protein